MELTAISEVLQTIGGGSLTALVLVAGVIAWRYGPTYFKLEKEKLAVRMEIAKAQERDNRLRKIHIRIMMANMEFLKEQGHDLEIPDITEDI